MQLNTIGLPIYDLLLFILPSFQLKGLCNNTCVLFKMRIWSNSLKEFTLPWIGRVGLLKAFVIVCYKMHMVRKMF